MSAPDDGAWSGEIRAVLGLDIGGTSSRARLRAGDEVVDVEGPGANVATLDPAVVEGRLTALLSKLGEARPAACCAGAAGAEVPAARQRLAELLERTLQGCTVTVVHDARLVLAAAGLESGIALIAGTGSVAYARSEGGREARRGGWGWMIGDDGSGAWIAREAARLVMLRADEGADVGELGSALLAACGAPDPHSLLGQLHARREAGQWAALASVVFDSAGADAGSRDIIVRAAAALAALVMPLREVAEGPVVLAGGLLLHQPRLEAEVRKQLPVACVRLEQPPVEGAVRLAQALLAR